MGRKIRANLQRLIERNQAIKLKQADDLKQADEMQQSGELKQADEMQQSDELKQTAETQKAARVIDLEKMPWGTVIVLAVLCVASLITGVVYWYNNYYLSSDHGGNPSVSEEDTALPSVGNSEQNQGLIQIPAATDTRDSRESGDALAQDEEPEHEVAPMIPDMDPLPEFIELWEEYGNEDIVGILYLAEHEEFVLQADDNSFYLTHDINREQSETGSVFLDYGVDLLMGMDYNMVVYIPYDVAIREVLREYINYDFFLMHPTLTLATLYGDFDWEIFSFYIAPDTVSFMTVNYPDDYVWGEAVMHFTLASLYNTRLDVTEFDQIITIVTPTDVGSGIYYVLQARMLRQITS